MTSVRDVCAQLQQIYPGASGDWGLIGAWCVVCLGTCGDDECAPTHLCIPSRTHTGKEKGKPVRLWLPDDEPLSAFPNINMHYLLYRRRDEVAQKHRRESVQVRVLVAIAGVRHACDHACAQVKTTESKPTTCLGVSPDDLDQIDDRGTSVPGMSWCCVVECDRMQYDAKRFRDVRCDRT
jgi:hypothetical protein